MPPPGDAEHRPADRHHLLPGGDFPCLANARSIPIADAIQRRFDDLDYQHDIGEIDLNISGCMNSCGHHHVGHIGILGVDKNDEEWYQVSIGGTTGQRHPRSAIDRPSLRPDQGPGRDREACSKPTSNCAMGTSASSTPYNVGTRPSRARVYADRQPQRRKPPMSDKIIKNGRVSPTTA